MKKVSVLMVCTANICRSPMAEALLRLHAERAGLRRRLQVQSAGTQVKRGGERSDARAVKAAASLGADASRIRSRALRSDDFERHDYIVAMDAGHRARLEQVCPVEFAPKLHLLLEFAPETGLIEVPDPYFGNYAGFERVLGLLDAGVAGLLLQLRARHGL
ncbi:MAG TPA: low molecular weight protein-tyrosine-phosphatase [Pseudomonadales bacterium]|nr:low molecular weight protein-tyrosine-phosphatase [Pseudomonadales bacterium]HNC69866.1 low molecular weight protein-tyrosine-phosphatase [Pseudomonadales bacterium]HND14482.1 low molecular weight protein-tyrosine-phosphatase [Pseudomonadales bacterium]